MLALLAIFAPLGASFVDNRLATHERQELQLERLQMEQTVEKEVDERYESRLKGLSDQVEELRRTIPTKSGHGGAPSTTTKQ